MYINGRKGRNVCVSVPAAVTRVCRNVGPYVCTLLALFVLPSLLILYVTLYYFIVFYIESYYINLYHIVLNQYKDEI